MLGCRQIFLVLKGAVNLKRLKNTALEKQRGLMQFHVLQHLKGCRSVVGESILRSVSANE